MDLSKYKIPEENTKVKTEWQTEFPKWLEEFGIVQTMKPFCWKKLGKGGKNFRFLETKVASIKEKVKYYNGNLKESAGEFINILKGL